VQHTTGTCSTDQPVAVVTSFLGGSYSVFSNSENSIKSLSMRLEYFTW
jgi:hypothetical protein